ncbi:MAG: ABC transporter permease [Lachnospiraceae bacterium]|nr:ABC transporter permease [Lachnospiraceae bacterium]
MNKKSFWKNDGVQSFIMSLVCIIIGLLIGFIALLIINPAGAFSAIGAVIKNFFNYSSSGARIKYFGNTLVQTAPLIMCSLSVLFAYKVGLFNIGVAGQYVAGACACLYAALAWNWNWFFCMLFAVAAGALLGAVSGILKAYRNVNEVISGIMLNWIALYTTNMLLSNVKEVASPYTYKLAQKGQAAILPQLGLDNIFNKNKYVGIALLIAIASAVIVWVILSKTKFGYELKATGFNKNAAKYAGMAEKKNIIVSLAISGMLAGLGASLLFQTGFEEWSCTQSSVPAMGFNGIAAAFLGGLNPIGTLFSSYFIQHITSGGAHVDKTMYSAQTSDLISAIIVYLCGFVGFFKYLMNKIVSGKKDKMVKEDVKEKAKKEAKEEVKEEASPVQDADIVEPEEGESTVFEENEALEETEGLENEEGGER